MSHARSISFPTEKKKYTREMLIPTTLHHVLAASHGMVQQIHLQGPQQENSTDGNLLLCFHCFQHI